MKLLREGHSFSGHERNCAFLNCHPSSPRFANVSAVTGFDFPDDGRAAAFSLTTDGLLQEFHQLGDALGSIH